MSKQLGIAHFLGVKRPRVSQFQEGSYPCRYCTKICKSRAGLSSHHLKHKAAQDRLKTVTSKPGKVKIRYDLMSEEEEAEEAEEAEEEEEEEEDNALVEIVDSDSSDQLCNFFESNDDTTEEGKDESKSSGAIRGVNMIPKQVVKGLDAWYKFKEEVGDNKKKFCRVVMQAPLPDGFNKPKFQPLTLRRWLNDEKRYREDAAKQNADRRREGKTRSKDGRYPEMELRLACRVRHLRLMGIPIESWMLRFEGKSIFHEIYPENYPDPQADVLDQMDELNVYPIQFSNTWQKNFMKRHNFSFRKLSTKMNKKGKTPEMMATVKDYHMECRSFQLSDTPQLCNRDPTYGFTSPYYVFSHDQVPIPLASSNEMTIETIGEDEVYDSVVASSDEKRFATLNLTVPMRMRPDGKNNTKPHIVFKASKFQTADECHDQDKRQEWDYRVAVSFLKKTRMG